MQRKQEMNSANGRMDEEKDDDGAGAEDGGETNKEWVMMKSW